MGDLARVMLLAIALALVSSLTVAALALHRPGAIRCAAAQATTNCNTTTGITA